MKDYVKDMNYQSLDREIKRTMRRSAKDVVMLGYMLRRMMTAKLWDERYDCFDNYLRYELHIDYTMASRFIGINKKYSFGGESMEIDEKWEGYSQAVLIEMLSMPPELEAKITPDMTVKQVREVKRQARQEKVEKVEAEAAVKNSVMTDIPESVDDVSQKKTGIRRKKCDTYQGYSCDIERIIKNHFTKGGNITGCAGCCDCCMDKGKCEYTCEAVMSQKVKRQDDIPDAEYRELETVEEVATSQPKQSPYGLAKSEYPEGSLIATAGCGNKYSCFSCAQNCGIRQAFRYCTTAPLGNPFNCTTMEVLENLKAEVGDRCQFLNYDLASHTWGSGEAVPCCMDCEELCGYRCQRSSQGEGIPDAEYRELEVVEEVATSQCPQLVKPDEEQSRRLDDFAKYFISCEHDWFLADFDNRVWDMSNSPKEIKAHLKKHVRTWHFKSGSGVAHINLFEEYVQLWDETGKSAIDVDWFYLAAAIHRMWKVVAQDTDRLEGYVQLRDENESEPHDDVGRESEENQQQSDELAEIKRILKKEQKTLHEYLEVEGLPAALVFRQKTIVAALAAMICDLENEQTEAEAQENAVVQPELPKLKNNNQRKDWLNTYKSWGLWYRDDNIEVNYYKYDFDNGARLIAEVYPVEATKYWDAHDACYLHLVGGPEPPKGQYGIGKWTRNEKYSRYPNSETELVEFLKELQKGG